MQQLQPGAVGVNLQVHLSRGWCLVGLFACIITDICHISAMLTQVLKHPDFPFYMSAQKEQL